MPRGNGGRGLPRGAGIYIVEDIESSAAFFELDASCGFGALTAGAANPNFFGSVTVEARRAEHAARAEAAVCCARDKAATSARALAARAARGEGLLHAAVDAGGADDGDGGGGGGGAGGGGGEGARCERKVESSDAWHAEALRRKSAEVAALDERLDADRECAARAARDAFDACLECARQLSADVEAVEVRKQVVLFRKRR